jgi:hypothetical protein
MAGTWGSSGGFGGGGSSGGAPGSREAVGWKDGVGWLDAEGNPTDAVPKDFHGSDNPGHVFTDTKAPPVNLSDGNPNTSTSVIVPGQPVQAVGGTNGGNVTTYRAGIDDRPWTNVAQPSAYLYGGVPGGATNEVNRYTGLSAMADGRLAPQIASNQYGQQFGGDMGLDLASRQQEQQGLGNQLYGLSQLQGMIEGRGPSVAQQQQNMGLAQAMRQQASIAASARGGGANLAAAQQAASNAAAGLSGNAFMHGGLLRAQEQAGAINNYGGLANAYSNSVSGIRGQDQSRAQLTGQMANSQAALDLQSRNANDSRNLAYEQMRRGVFQDQMGARQAGEAMNNGIIQQNADRSQRADEHADAERDKVISGFAQGTGAVIGTFVAPGPGTAGGAAVGKGVGDVVSDVRAKKDVRPAGANVDQALDAMGAYNYQYKDPRYGKGPQTGPMAQELAATPVGRQAVAQAADGKLYIKGPQATGLALAGLARLNDRVRQVEATTGAPTPGRGLAAIAPVPADQVRDQRDFAAEQAEMRGLSAMAQQGQPVSAGSVQPADFGDAKMNAAGNAALVEHISAQRRPVTLEEYQAIARMPSSPEVDLFRQRPEFQGYGNVEGYAEPFPALPGSGLARITPPAARTARR